MNKTHAALKRVLVGRPKSSGELERTLLPKTIALPVFSSDPLSSNAYATQEILLVLGLAGAAALTNVIPISIAVAALLVIVVTSYRQTVRAYPTGGGAYIVAHENIGELPGLLAAAALLIDYVLTVAVSVVAGTDAIVSMTPSLGPYKIELAVSLVFFVMFANLRGVREAGTLFAIPTYGFVLSMYLMIGTGFARCVGGCPIAETAGRELEPQTALTFFLILRAFAAGTTALTGVEAISNGVPAFRYPQSRNAARTLAMMGALSASMFLGISWLANHTGVTFEETDPRTVVAQVAHTIFNGGPFFYMVQLATAAILILAANTAYQDFPRLSSILARDRFLPRQFLSRGDRLVFSNGVILLTVLASILVIVFDANLNRLIQLYLVGVFISFTLSQWGMVAHWVRSREVGWRKSLSINALGGTVTGIVLLIIVATKFLGGAWIVVATIPFLIYMMKSIHGHYIRVLAQLEEPTRAPMGRRAGNQHMVIYAPRIDGATLRAIGYVRSSRADVRAVTLDAACADRWNEVAGDIPIEILQGQAVLPTLRAYLESLRDSLDPLDFVTVVIPEVLEREGLFEIVRRPRLHRLKAGLLFMKGIQVIDMPMMKEEADSGSRFDVEPARNHAVVLVSAVHNATLQAIAFAQTLRTTDIRGLSIVLDTTEEVTTGQDWLEARIPYPLDIQASPFRDIGASVKEYVRQLRPDEVDRVVTVVIPEFVVPKKRHQILHGQTALLVKRQLLFERGVVVVSVPYHLDD